MRFLLFLSCALAVASSAHALDAVSAPSQWQSASKIEQDSFVYKFAPNLSASERAAFIKCMDRETLGQKPEIGPTSGLLGPAVSCRQQR
jgi:hypothetical protein